MVPDDAVLRGRLLRSARLLLDWSQARLACEAGISSGTVCAVESGRLGADSPAARAMV
jgi:transcriptional regulator with XRE-family HTH domain